MSVFLRNLLILCSGFGVVSIIFYLLNKSDRSRAGSDLDSEITNWEKYEYIPELAMKDLICFFKDPKRLDLLRNNKNIIACAVRSPIEDHFFITCALFDTDAGEILEFAGFRTDRLDETLASSFGNKDMIVLK